MPMNKLFKLLIRRGGKFFSKKCKSKCVCIHPVFCIIGGGSWWECTECNNAINNEIIKKMGLNREPFKVESKKKVKGCEWCGGSFFEIRGRHPKQPRRLVCPTCLQEKLEDSKQDLNPHRAAKISSE